MLFMSGIVTEPVPTTFATELPEIVPWQALEMTEAFAGPPTELPVRPTATFVSQSPMPDFFKKAAKIMKRKMNVDETSIGMPSTPSVPIHWNVAMRSTWKPGCARKPGMSGPKYA